MEGAVIFNELIDWSDKTTTDVVLCIDMIWTNALDRVSLVSVFICMNGCLLYLIS